MSAPTITIIDNLYTVAQLASDLASELVADLRKDLDDLGHRDPEFHELRDKWNPPTAAWGSLIEKMLRRSLLTPEDTAMLQALYSRSPKTVLEHLAKVCEVGAGNFMGSYYVGYGHASIGDCGTTSVFIEGTTMLAAKALQDWPLYSGQEASTRYMDFSKVLFENPVGTSAGEEIQERWRSFYMKALPIVRTDLLRRYPDDGDDPKAYDRAINARAFDITRAWLPAGAHTNLSWTTNLRQANDKLGWLVQHPDRAVADLGGQVLAALKERYPHSFGDVSLKTAREGGQNEDVERYQRDVMSSEYFLHPEELSGRGVDLNGGMLHVDAQLDLTLINRYRRIFDRRPRGAELPHFLAECGLIHSMFLLDFASFRDLQRHRNGTIRMPLLTTRFGFHPWYRSELPEELRAEAAELLQEQVVAIDRLQTDEVTVQNYVAMGFLVSCAVTQSLPAFVYRLEIRSAKTVHPTLRQVIHDEIAWLKRKLPAVSLYADMNPDSWTIRRGRQTIEERR